MLEEPKANTWVEVYYEGDWVPFLVHGTNKDSDDIYVHGWLFRPEHDGAQWHGSSRAWESCDGIPSETKGSDKLQWRA